MTDPVTGLIGRMTSPIRDAGALGEVLVAIRGGTESYIARAREPIAAGVSVLVIAAHPGRVVDVVPWLPLVPDPVEEI